MILKQFMRPEINGTLSLIPCKEFKTEVNWAEENTSLPSIRL